MEIKVEGLILTGIHPDGDSLKNQFVCIEFDGVQKVVEIEKIINALRAMSVR